MKKEYQKPVIEMISLVVREEITDDVLDGETDVESSIFDD